MTYDELLTLVRETFGAGAIVTEDTLGEIVISTNRSLSGDGLLVPFDALV